MIAKLKELNREAQILYDIGVLNILSAKNEVHLTPSLFFTLVEQDCETNPFKGGGNHQIETEIDGLKLFTIVNENEFEKYGIRGVEKDD